MFWNCLQFDASKVWPALLFVIAFIRNVETAGTTAECKTFIIASTLGTFGACFLIFVTVLLLLRRFSRKPELRGSLRKDDLEHSSHAESIQFENVAAISQDKDDTDSGIASPVSPTVPDPQAAITKNVGTQTCDLSTTKFKQQSVFIEKRQNGSLGLNLAIAGLYVKGIDADATSKQLGNVEPGDEIISINGVLVDGMTDMEALALAAKSGPNVQLQVAKHAFLLKVDDSHNRIQHKRKTTQSPQSSMCDSEALKKAKLEIGEALMELRRCTSHGSKTSHPSCMKSHEKSNSQQSFMDSIELQRTIAEEDHTIMEEDFVVIDSPEVSHCQDGSTRNNESKIEDREIIKEESITSLSKTKNVARHNDESLSLTSGSADPNAEQHCTSTVVDPVCDSAKIQDDSIVANGSVHSSSDIRTDLSTHAEEPRHNKALSLQLKTNYSRQSRASPPEEPQGFPIVNGNHSLAGSPVHGTSMGGIRPAAYYVVENGHVASPVFYTPEEDVLPAGYVPDLDKIKPPPSYEIASLTFNSQKPGSKSYSGGSSSGSFAEYKIPINTESTQMNSIHNSTNSSFDDLDPAIAAYLSKSSRDSVSIDEHVMRYMTKKYSEPRFPVTTHTPTFQSSSPPTVNPIAPSSSNPRFGQPDYVTRSRSGSDYLDEYHRKILNDASDINTYPATAATALHRSATADSLGGIPLSGIYMDDNKRNLMHYNDHEGAIIMNSEFQNRRLSNERFTNSLTDIYREFESSLDEITPSKEIPITNKPQRMTTNIPGRLLRQRFPTGEVAKNIRRAASSPSVNSDHQRGGSNETYNADSQSVQRRNHRNQRNRRSKVESFDRRKSIDSGSLRKLAAELQANQTLSEDLPMISRLLGGLGIPNADKASKLYRYNSSDTLY